MNYYNALNEKLLTKSAKIGIIGLGYVGLPLALEYAKNGFKVYGIDVDEKKVDMLNKSESYITDINSLEIQEVISNKKFIPTTDFSILKDLDAVCICVPTPLKKSQEPDTSYITNSIAKIIEFLHEGMLITLESTTYPGTTEEFIEKPLLKLGYSPGENYFLCFSPERVDPGNKFFNIKNTPKVIGGTSINCTRLGALLYSFIVDEVVEVSSPKVAEMSKLLENTFRSINIAFINEMAMLSEKIDVDIWEAIEAASSKPFGFMKFTPGPGIGGHCIPLDPMYLSWKAKEHNFQSRFIELAQDVNKNMPEKVVNKISRTLNKNHKALSNSSLLLLGMAYKPEVGDIRESPSLEIFDLLKAEGANVSYNDNYSKTFINKTTGELVESIEYQDIKYSDYDCVIFLTKHKYFNIEKISQDANLIFDTRNAFKDYQSDKIYKI